MKAASGSVAVVVVDRPTRTVIVRRESAESGILQQALAETVQEDRGQQLRAVTGSASSCFDRLCEGEAHHDESCRHEPAPAQEPHAHDDEQSGRDAWGHASGE